MKRPSHSFVVEVRRQRRPPGEPAPSWTEELQKPQPNVAAREAAPPPRPTAATAPARPTGRILPSLIEAPPLAAPPPAAKPPKPTKPVKPAKSLKSAKPRIQPPRPRVSAPQLIRVPEPPLMVAAPPPLAEPATEAVGQDRSARHRRILARYVFGDASKPGERWKRRFRSEAT
jgi:hypothetical protein